MGGRRSSLPEVLCRVHTRSGPGRPNALTKSLIKVLSEGNEKSIGPAIAGVAGSRHDNATSSETTGYDLIAAYSFSFVATVALRTGALRLRPECCRNALERQR